MGELLGLNSRLAIADFIAKISNAAFFYTAASQIFQIVTYRLIYTPSNISFNASLNYVTDPIHLLESNTTTTATGVQSFLEAVYPHSGNFQARLAK
ncbi:MAG: hypothetical protein AAGI69_14230 [Cyanobacteria bacterium P01_H01_bin.21]